MTRNKIIDKIAKCLRLSESCNPHEAAMAIRQAHTLMKKYQVSEQQVLIGQVCESQVNSGLDYTPPFWSLALSNLVAQAFGCRAYVSRKADQPSGFRFIGIGHAAEISAYTFNVLYRRLRQARREFIRQLELANKTEKTRRGDIFAQAWLFRISKLVADFSNSEQNQAAVEQYVSQHYGVPAEMQATAKAAGTPDYADILSGMQAASGVSLLRPVAQQSRSVLSR